ncbi:MAG: class I SAM-dependent methyltransferase [Asgard group archaeon]|nr:class I SAM-dependent methyltransferase [Asgard group archaeon]
MDFYHVDFMSRSAFIPDETEELRKWHKEHGKQFFKEIGVKQGDFILDFGCGSGPYTLPAAEVVGTNGKVYAIDNEQICIDELKKSIKSKHLEEIVEPIKTDGGFSFPIENESIDFVFLIDMIGVILHHKRTLKAIEDLLSEITRIIKSTGKVVIIFKHVKQWRESKENVDLIISGNFSLVKHLDLLHIHWDFLEKDSVYLYKKK